MIFEFERREAAEEEAAQRRGPIAPSPGEAGAPPDYVKINKAIHHIYELHHGEVLRAWEATHGPLRNDNLISIQQMRVELVREALGAALSGDREDSERLDWLGEFHDGFYNTDRISSVQGRGFASESIPESQHWYPTLRKAIDAARSTPAAQDV